MAGLCLEQEGADVAAFDEAAGLGRVAYAVNCAGVDGLEPSASMSAEAWNRVVAVDLDGVFFACQAEYAAMRRQGGSIVNIASMSGHIVNRGVDHAAYGSAKAGVIHLSRSLGVEWAADGVRVNSVSPGYVRTETTRHVEPDLLRSFADLTPLGRLADVHEVAAPVLFLLGSGAAYVRATDLLVDGGYTAW